MTERRSVAELHLSELARARYQQIETDLREAASQALEFEFDPSGSHLFSLMELRQSYARRAVDLVDAIFELLECDRIVPAATLGRALIETVAMGALFLDDMLACIRARNRERLELRLTRFYAGTSGHAVKPIHVMDAIRHLEKLDAEYVAYLDGKYGMFTAADALRAALAEGAAVKSHAELLSMVKVYDELSEIAHPNGTGVQYLYPDPRNENDDVKRVLALYNRHAVASVWQCKHLLRALEDTRELPNRYREAFLASAR